MHTQLYTIDRIADIIADRYRIVRPDDEILHLIYDTRKINDGGRSLFFALKADLDGHAFIEQAYRAGVRNFVVIEGKVDERAYPDANFLFVESTLAALQQLAKYHRTQFDIPVIAITGSNGKTIVKEWLFQLLYPEFNIARSPKSYNSQLGVALSLWQLSAENTLAIIEAGISRVGEMERLQNIIRPTIGVLTNIGTAHSEGFKSNVEKLSEKLFLFKGAEKLILSPKYISVGTTLPENTEVISWGDEEGCDLQIKEINKGTYTQITAIYKGETVDIQITLSDDASIENAISCWTVLLGLGYAPELIKQRMIALFPVEMRLELKNGINNCSIIDDSYSCDVASLIIALNFLQQQNQAGKKTVILSDIPEIKGNKESVYRTVAQLIKINKIDRFIGVGEEISSFRHLFDSDSLFYSSTEGFLAAAANIGFQDEVILLKGARVFSFERISRILTQKTHDTALEINLKALERNLKYYKSRLQPNTKLMVMVKAFSYGSGSFEIANLLQFNQVDYLAVAYPDEGVTLRKSGITLPIMVMNVDTTSFEAVVSHELEPEIFSLTQLTAFVDFLESRDIANYPIHIKLETGMHRLGFEENDLDKLLQFLRERDAIRVASVFSHLAASGSAEHDDFTRLQISTFDRISSVLQEALPYSFIRHLSNTAAIDRWPTASFDMVRLGIGLYGIASADDYQLEPVARLKTRISQIKQIHPEDTVGYNRKGKLLHGGTIATVKIGYADGYNRRFGNGVGRMLVDGKLVPTIGDICMDMCMLDVTGQDVKEGDSVEVFGEVLNLMSLADAIGTIPYELMTGISQRVKRVYFYE
ncbi:bifunctional UDP-N-acetylmuramoyl-tripeptide:D-alanyl-D-alanine ligase/alanine racemase [Albibacterium indicum]|uniref:bifunctional UDP-N-acetylmuramoyl-tripeptide:D-alanyl-D-alanine ligase/alanine racemase n=1 Tax=Albibacterium indicum TaxID=2292082 RepID=UPI000E531F00|nr:bifunctional UDP-N-acetylmuramoyl-tripeptide:D-alanyl-D-alanine ligase/alanine racemase [Pedobacter indicus]